MNNPDKITNQNTTWHKPTVHRPDREKLNGHKSVILWFTGLSASGKSTLAHAVEDFLYQNKVRTFVLDGDNVRQGLCKDLGFSDADRNENIRRIGEISKLMLHAGIITMTAFISPFKKDRDLVRKLVDAGDFIEIFCNADLKNCEARDPKGLYKKARAGQIPEFTGVSSPYEAPDRPELTVDTVNHSVAECVEQVLRYLQGRGIIQ